MKQKIGLFALIALLSCPVFGQMNTQSNRVGVGLSTASLDDNGYFKPKKKKKKKKKKADKEEANTEWKDNIWYGASGVLGLGSSGNYSQFAIGIQPMVGYRIFKFLSVGPRLGLVYQLEKEPFTQSTTKTTTAWLKTAGLFTRLRFWNLFVHAEANQEWVSYKAKIPNFPESKRKDSWSNQYIGIGWNEGRPKAMGYEILLLVNIKNAQDPDYQYVPIELRGGLTYNF